MKKLLLSLLLSSTIFWANGQLLLNELYVRPNKTKPNSEYFEFYNSGSFMAGAQLDGYSMLTYYEDGNEKGWYVVDLPNNLAVSTFGFIVGASDNPFNYQGGTNHAADFDYNNNAQLTMNGGSLKKYVLQGNTYGAGTLSSSDDIFLKSPNSGQYIVLLFKYDGTTNQLVDGFFGQYKGTTFPADIANQGDLTYTTNLGTFTVDFNNLDQTLFGNVRQEAGTDNGYHRINQGSDCTPGERRAWTKTSSPFEHTPGAPNNEQGNGAFNSPDGRNISAGGDVLSFLGTANNGGTGTEFAPSPDCVKSNQGFDFYYKGAQLNADGSYTLKFAIKNNNGYSLSNAAFELPTGAAITPYNTYKATYTYSVENTTNNPFRSIKFNASNASNFKNGGADHFVYRVSAADFNNMSTIRVQAKAGQKIGQVTFNKNSCNNDQGDGSGDDDDDSGSGGDDDDDSGSGGDDDDDSGSGGDDDDDSGSGGDDDDDSGSGGDDDDDSGVCVKTAECYEFTYNGYTLNPDGTYTFEFKIKVNCAHDLSNVAFELPGNSTAISPVNSYSSTYNYTIENGTNNPFRSIKFEGQGINGYKNGQSDVFRYTVSAATFNAMDSIRVQAKAATTVGTVTFDKNGCAPGGGDDDDDDGGSGGDDDDDSGSGGDDDDDGSGETGELMLFGECVPGNIYFEVIGGTDGDYPATVTLYRDNDFNGEVNAGDQQVGAPQTIQGPGTGQFPIPAGEALYILVLETAGGCNEQMAIVQCEGAIVTPVTLKNFHAVRKSSNVSLTWETATERDNKGFFIERRIGNGNWETLGFVNSAAAGGNSDASLRYAYNDVNLSKGISHYRLRQVDLNGRFKHSDMRSVRGEDLQGKTIVYPNPSKTGAATIVFEEANAARDIHINDMNGRVIKQWRGITSSTLEVNGLPSGVYMIRIVNQQDGAQSIERLVVNR